MAPNSYCSSIVAIGWYYNSGYMYVCMYDTHTPGDDVIYYKRNNISYSKSDTRWATRTNYGRELRPPLRRKNPPRKWRTLYIISTHICV